MKDKELSFYKKFERIVAEVGFYSHRSLQDLIPELFDEYRKSREPRMIVLYTGLVRVLRAVYKHVKNRGGGYRFNRKEIKHLIVGNENDTARFGDWAMFGGLVFKEGKGQYGINVERCEDFFSGRERIPTKIIKDMITGELTKTEYKYIHQIPKLTEFLDEEGMYTGHKVTGQQKDLFS
jgi:hypothetical protein